MQEAAKGASLQEMMFEALLKKQRGQNKGLVPGSWQYGRTSVGKETLRLGTEVKPPAPQNPPYKNKLMEQRRQASLCFKCGDKYTLGHQCQK